VRSMVRSRRVGWGARSREINHWMIGRMPVWTTRALYFAYSGDETRTPYTPKRARVPDNAGQFRKLEGEVAGGFMAQTRAMLETGSCS
jgi:hypothetical protein